MRFSVVLASPNTCLLLFIDFFKETLIVEELLLVHLARCSLGSFSTHLILQEGLVISVDLLDFALKTLLLELIIVFVLLPNLSLLII